MAATLNDFYLRYRNKVARTLENDAYYQYLFELLECSPHTIQQTNRILHKEVDEKWLTRVEEGITAIDAIISKPRRFIASNEAVVPIELAKKITADSVKHLARNTQFIGEIKGGNIQPTKILNVTTEESYNLYENRFIYTLIKRLVTFIDKRTDIIFWSTGDEKESRLSIASEMEDDYEAISYTLEMNIKNKQSYMETDAQHMDVFKRIDRVRRIVMEFKRSPFMEIMSGTSEVRSPIQRTNLLMKDPNYKKCYTLWAFLEQYDDVGYSIDVKETALDFDEEYLYQMYTNMILNYTVFKSLLENDERPIDQNVKRRKKIKPKFVKQIVEEIVDDYDIPDVEVRKVIIEEITRAQARIEQRQAAAEKKRLEKEKQKEKERLAREKEQAKKKALEEKEKAKAKAAAEKEKARLKALEEKEKAKAREAAEKEKAKAKAAAEREKARLKAAEEKAKERAKAKALAEQEKAKAKAAAEKEKARLKALEEKEKAKAREAAEKEKAKAKAAAEREKARLKAAEEKAKERAKAKALAEQEKAKAKAAAEKEKARLKALEEKEKAKAREAEEKEKARLKALEEKEKNKDDGKKPPEKTAEELEMERRMEAVRRANEAARRRAEKEQMAIYNNMRQAEAGPQTDLKKESDG